MNSDLKHDKYVLPDKLIERLTHNLNNMGSNDKGYTRVKNLLDQGHLNYGQAKKFKHELENDLTGNDYENVCGDDMLSFINNCLNNRREGVKSVKKAKMNAGMENQFLKTHTKDKSKNPTKVRNVKVSTKNDDIINNRAIYENIDRIKQLLK
tara:strand:- start:224 stop:679 length:456 start_codon:yes stop_codon:yes gene_type:complete